MSVIVPKQIHQITFQLILAIVYVFTSKLNFKFIIHKSISVLNLDIEGIVLSEFAYNNKKLGYMKMPEDSHPNFSDLKLYYRFDDASGTTLVDLTGNQDGTLTGMDLVSSWVSSARGQIL